MNARGIFADLDMQQYGDGRSQSWYPLSKPAGAGLSQPPFLQPICSRELTKQSSHLQVIKINMTNSIQGLKPGSENNCDPKDDTQHDPARPVHNGSTSKRQDKLICVKATDVTFPLQPHSHVWEEYCQQYYLQTARTMPCNYNSILSIVSEDSVADWQCYFLCT